MASFNNLFSLTVSAIRSHGLFRTFKQILVIGIPKSGKLVGKDEFGNEYYENRNDPVFRGRWVLYSKWNVDASQVPAEWHHWLHSMTDDVPTAETVPKPFFARRHTENVTGSTGAFKTYSTVTPKIESWAPVAKSR
ncbi:NADH ubiquinone oxidoreductase subunit NDUFA12-domain-containing protein [Zopfochytrium polystomum]|nr:NADH ubiquinone oxidoreductase subunit NDUFA12-domain-containing protein [Zopfochytrium polystomum]